ncbi:hypothetical protein GIW81_03985 [Hyphomicrobium sp. xq]|uniref:Uncharacterized protein n=1 Tax=Hyphomicrobium album TaxID=2665159 RepID=A0A6I3KGF9_9HYPH|nr:hypothetical protein [Hyphomicrobium album]MTD93493.1 hypothetical protein [Hyphomicrobium album]
MGGRIVASDKVLMTVELASPTLANAAKSLGVKIGAIDKDFGIVPIDPDRHLYSIKVSPEAVPSMAADAQYRGPFSNPRIGTYGPPKSGIVRK